MLGHQSIFFKHMHYAMAYLSHIASGTSSWLDSLYGPSLRNLHTAQNMNQQAATKIKCYKSICLSYKSKTNRYKPCTPVQTSDNIYFATLIHVDFQIPNTNKLYFLMVYMITKNIFKFDRKFLHIHHHFLSMCFVVFSMEAWTTSILNVLHALAVQNNNPSGRSNTGRDLSFHWLHDSFLLDDTLIFPTHFTLDKKHIFRKVYRNVALIFRTLMAALADKSLHLPLAPLQHRELSSLRLGICSSDPESELLQPPPSS